MDLWAVGALDGTLALHGCSGRWYSFPKPKIHSFTHVLASTAYTSLHYIDSHPRHFSVGGLILLYSAPLRLQHS